MFYVLIFSLAAVILIVAFFTAMARRRRTLQGEDGQAGIGGGHTTSAVAAHGTHPDAAARRNRKANRAQSQHDRRKRH